MYRERYWKQEHFQAMESLKELLAVHHPEENISLPGAALWWIYHHSLLDGAKGDCVVLGASRMEQLQINMEMSQAGPIKEDVVPFEDEW